MTKKVLILGANGRIARLAEKEFLTQTDDELKLFLRNPERLQLQQPQRESVIDGDATVIN